MSKAGFVYILTSLCLSKKNLYKIGRTEGHIEKRLSALNTSHCGEENLLFCFNRWFVHDCHFMENFLHEKFANYRRGGEFFELSAINLVSIAYLFSKIKYPNKSEIFVTDDEIFQCYKQSDILRDLSYDIKNDLCISLKNKACYSRKNISSLLTNEMYPFLKNRHESVHALGVNRCMKYIVSRFLTMLPTIVRMEEVAMDKKITSILTLIEYIRNKINILRESDRAIAENNFKEILQMICSEEDVEKALMSMYFVNTKNDEITSPYFK